MRAFTIRLRFVMQLLLRILASVALTLLIAFCAFGFLATFEPAPPVRQWTWRIGYTLAAAAMLWALLLVWRSSADRLPGR